MQYEIIGGNFPAVVCHLDSGETMITEAGAMLWMDPCISMQTSSGGVGKMFGRMFSGESLFLNQYHANAAGKIAFGTCTPGEILAVNVTPNTDLIVQKNGFLAAQSSVELSTHFNKKLGSGVFGGEGFVMQRISGQGMAFLECDGGMVEYELAPGQQLIVDTGNVFAFTSGVNMEIERIKGVANMFAGGEGLFNTRLTGPGKVWLQTMPMPQFAQVVNYYIPSN